MENQIPDQSPLEETHHNSQTSNTKSTGILKKISSFFESIGKLTTFLTTSCCVLLFVTKDKTIPYVQELLSIKEEVQYCRNGDDEILGSVFLNGNTLKGTAIELKVFNKFTGQTETKINELKTQDGRFVFHLCKATTEKVEFITHTYKSDEPIINTYPASAIPDSVILSQ